MSPFQRKEVIGDCELYLGDCLKVLPTIGRTDAVITDPPYFGVKEDTWDNQWQSREDFLKWADAVCSQLTRTMADNASLYWFCSPQLASRVELMISDHLHVLNNIVWDKGNGRNGAAGSGVDVTALRSYWTANTERVVFAEKPLGDSEASLTFGVVLRKAFSSAGVSNRQIAALFPSVTGGLTGCVSNWLLGLNVPTEAQWQRMDVFLRGHGVVLPNYNELLCQYEAIRRPMSLSPDGEWGDVWRFRIERAAEHPTQKPLALMKHVVGVSSRPRQVLLDPFMGSGTTGVACVKLGRKFIGIEIEPKYFDIACERIRKAYAQPDMFIAPTTRPVQEALFDGAPA